MLSEAKLGRIETVLENLTYPISRSEAGDRLSGTALLLADGEADLGGLVSETGFERFESADDLESELDDVLPREAVREPSQAEGEG